MFVSLVSLRSAEHQLHVYALCCAPHARGSSPPATLLRCSTDGGVVSAPIPVSCRVAATHTSVSEAVWPCVLLARLARLLASHVVLRRARHRL